MPEAPARFVRHARRHPRVWLLLIALIAAMLAAVGVYLSRRGFGMPPFAESERALVLREMRARPGDFWPRGTGHAPLSTIGLPARAKAYLEPGGSFSPAVGSFGVAIWVRGGDGRVIATSDTIALAATRHRYRMDDPAAPAIAATTPYYTAAWSARADGRRALHLVNRTPARATIEVVVRSVGPAGAPVRHLAVADGALLVGDRWRIALPGGARTIALGDEHAPGWKDARNDRREVRSASGWAYARIAAGPETLDLVIDPLGVAPSPPPVPPPPTVARVETPDADFDASVEAQRATLTIGLVGNQTRPGEPVNYPLAWQRDGAYVVVALARTGDIDLARRLAVDFARHDFFGGFGAEADAPGLALWVLAEVAAAGGDADFARGVWPDVVRKAAWIRQLSTATADVHAKFTGPVVPKVRGRSNLDLLANPARAGLIDGRMDLQRPIFFVNATAYLGLRDAARIAALLGHEAEAKAWAADARQLQTAWRDAFDRASSGTDRHDATAGGGPIAWARRLWNRVTNQREPAKPITASDVLNPRTAISGLWPTDVAAAEGYRHLIDSRWSALSGGVAAREPPPWTYFTVAEAHQWLRLDRPDRVWPVLRALWARQPIPGLFTLWEGTGEENSFGAWNAVRGWVAPPNVTPHYWSAAEVLLLQLEMMAYVDDEGLVLGAGVPAAWLDRPFRATAIGTGHGAVSYAWDGRTIRLRLPDGLRGRPLRLGPNFPAGTTVVLL